MIRKYNQLPLPDRIWIKDIMTMCRVHQIQWHKPPANSIIIDAVLPNGDLKYFLNEKNSILMQPIYAKYQNGVEIYELDTDGESVVVYDTFHTEYYLFTPGTPHTVPLPCRVKWNYWEIKGHIFQPEFKDLYDAVREELGI